MPAAVLRKQWRPVWAPELRTVSAAHRYGVTTASAVPSKLQALAREILSSHSPEDAAARAAPCASLKRVLSGGEALTVTMATEVKAALPHCELHNSYGPTETTVGECGYTPHVVVH